MEAQRQGVAAVTYSAFTRGAGLLLPAVSVRPVAALRVSAVCLAQTGFKSFNLHGDERQSVMVLFMGPTRKQWRTEGQTGEHADRWTSGQIE